MENKTLVIGLGAAGNKAAIKLVEDGVKNAADIILINSTDVDVPAAYKGACYLLKGTSGGFGKERTKSKNAMIYFLKSGELPIKEKLSSLDDEGRLMYKKAIVIASTEGGTGSGASVILAKYIKDVIKIPVHIIGIAGFGKDGRGLSNTMEFLNDVEEGTICSMVKNDSFMSEYNSEILAEKAANDQIETEILIEEGKLIKESEQNIDQRDLYKVSTTPGYHQVEFMYLKDKIRNKKDFAAALTEMLDNSHHMETKPSQTKMAVILNMNENSQLFCDDYQVLLDRLGKCYEIYTHRQFEGNKEYIAVISAGLKMPIEEAKEVYERYKEASDSVDKSEDSFYSEIKKMKGNSEDSKFDMVSTEINSGSEDDFFASFETSKKESKEASNIEDY